MRLACVCEPEVPCVILQILVVYLCCSKRRHATSCKLPIFHNLLDKIVSSPANLSHLNIMTRKKTSPKAKSSVVRKRRQARKQSHVLSFEALESRQLLAAVTVGNATDILSPTADTSSIAALVANDGGDGISLREAIVAANNTAGEDSITFDAGVFTGDNNLIRLTQGCLLYTSPSPRDLSTSRMPSSA